MNRIFHVHSYRCKHASDEKEVEYVEKAVELGASEIVFTDHTPFPGNPFNNRMTMEELDDYISVLRELKHRFAGRIDVRAGLEIEFIPAYGDYYKSLRDVWGLDLLLLGQHFSALPDGTYTFDLQDKSSEHRYLAEGLISGMEIRLFDAAAHPDQIFRRVKKWNSETDVIAEEIKKCAVRTGTVLEQNVSNMREKKRNRLYRPEFWTEVPEGLKIRYGVDAHSAEEMQKYYQYQQELQQGERG